MIKTLRYIALALVALCLVIFALANRSPVPVRLLTDDLGALTGITGVVVLPAWVLMLAGILVGMVLGFVWEWLRSHKTRVSARSGKREVARMERELAVMKDASSIPQDDVLALLDKPKAQ
jgi:lipopolysaccharide assembly protein A